MLAYEVNLEINPAIYQEFMTWLPGHIKQILCFEGFQQAHLWIDTANETHPKVSVQYKVDTMENLQHYFDHHAAEMRADAIHRFGDAFKASRRVLQLQDILCV